MLKQILSNTVAQLVAKAVGVALTFITTVMIIRISGPSLYGDLTKALSLVAIGFTVIDFGLNAVAVRSMNGDLSKQKDVLLDTILARALLSLLSILIVNLIVYSLPGGYTPTIKSVFWIGSLSIFFQGLYTSLNSWFQRRLAYWKMSLSTILGTVVGTILTYLAIVYSPSLSNLLAANTIGYLVMGITSILLGPKLVFRLPSHVLRQVLRILKISLPLGIVLVFSILASKLDSIVLGIYRPSSEVGQYGFAYRIFEVILVLPVFVMNTVYPLLIDNVPAAKHKLVKVSSVALLVLAILGVICTWFLSPYISLIRPDMGQSIASLRLLVLSLPLFYVTAPLMWQLIEGKLERYLMFVYGFAAIFNGAGNLFFAPLFGAVASSILTGLTEAIILIGLLLVKKYRYENSKT